MPFDFPSSQPPAKRRSAVGGARARGEVSEATGRAAEAQVTRLFEARGARLTAARWRGRAGEIDLVFQQGDEVVFVEVKASRSHEAAARHLQPRQLNRLRRAMEEYLGTCPAGSLTPMRFDLALVDGTGAIEIVENALPWS